jgi:hypothetical protein
MGVERLRDTAVERITGLSCCTGNSPSQKTAMKIERKAQQQFGDSWLNEPASRRELASGTDALIAEIKQLQ